MFRYGIGTDYMLDVMRMNYIIYYGTIKLERGYEELIKLINFLFGDIHVVFMVTAIITNIAFGYTIYKNVNNKYRILMVFVYICSTVYFATMNIQRQYLAISILIFGFESLKKQKYIKYLIYITIATLIHKSSLFVILFLCLAYLHRYKNIDIIKIMNTLIIVSIPLMFIDLRKYIIKVLVNMPLYSRYLLNSYLRESFFETRNISAIMKCIVPIITWFFLYFNKNSLMRKHKYLELYMIGWSIYIIISNLFYGINIFIRVYTFFEYFVLYIIPLIINEFKFKTNRYAITICFVLYYILLTSYSIFYKGGSGVMPYSSIFSAEVF